MRRFKSRFYWITLSFVLITGVFFILNFSQNGFLYAYIILLLFWLTFYIFNKKKRSER